jgi:rare lipoprotein A
MGRWIVIISLAMAQCPDITAAAPQSSDLPLSQPRPARGDQPAPTVKAVAMPRAARPVVAFEETQAEESPIPPSPGEAPQEAPQDQMPEAEAPRFQAPVPRKSGIANGGCSGGRRIISAYYWQGQRTASGQPFDPHGMTAAHRTLPFGTRLTVSNPRTGKSVAVVINDRGPFVSGVSLDLSLGAAQAIGMRSTGAVCIW